MSCFLCQSGAVDVHCSVCDITLCSSCAGTKLECPRCFVSWLARPEAAVVVRLLAEELGSTRRVVELGRLMRLARAYAIPDVALRAARIRGRVRYERARIRLMEELAERPVAPPTILDHAEGLV